MDTEELRILAIEILNTSQILIQHSDRDNLNLAVTNIDRLTSYLEELAEQGSTIVWLPNLLVYLEEITDILVVEGEAESTETSKGRPKINISISMIENLLNMHFNVPVIATLFGVSRDTIFRRMRESGLSVSQTYTQIDDPTLQSVVLEILTNFPNTGYKRMKGFLREKSIRCTDKRVREVMRTVDPDGVYNRLRQNRAVARRLYFVKYSNDMWHLDTNLKLIRWNIVIRGCIDGKSRTVTYLNASSDNKADSNLLAFMGAVQQYGIPKRTRSDKGKENVLIAKFMIEKRGSGRCSHICGRSVHNQRIERYWRDVTYGCTGFYKNVFETMEEMQVLNVENTLHLYILHKIFLPRINRHLNSLMNSWNFHPLSSENNLSPRQLMLISLPPQNADLALTEDDFENLRFVVNSLDDLVLFEETNSLVQPDDVIYNLPERARNYLQQIDPLVDSTNYGVDVFVSVLSYIITCL